MFQMLPGEECKAVMLFLAGIHQVSFISIYFDGVIDYLLMIMSGFISL